MNRCALVATLCLVASCADDEPDHGEVLHPCGTRVTFSSYGSNRAATVLYAQVDDGGWAPVQLRPGLDVDRYTVCVSEAYAFAAGCFEPLSGTLAVAHEYRGTPAEMSEVSVLCGSSTEGRTARVLQGTMQQPGSVFVSNVSMASISSNWTYSLVVEDAPRYDLAAVGDDGQLAFRRDVLPDGSGILSSIDLNLEGLPLAVVELTLAEPDPLDQVQTFSRMKTRNDTRFEIVRSAGLVSLVPDPAQVEPGDAVLLGVQLSSQDAGTSWLRSIDEELAVAEMDGLVATALPKLPATLVPTTDGVLVSAIPTSPWSLLEMRTAVFGEDRRLTVTRGWFDLHQDDERVRMFTGPDGEWAEPVEVTRFSLSSTEPGRFRSTSVSR